MKTLKAEAGGKIIFDGIEKEPADIDGPFLTEVFELAMVDEIEFDIDETNPRSQLFIDIRESTKKGSPFREKMSKLNNGIRLMAGGEPAIVADLEAEKPN